MFEKSLLKKVAATAATTALLAGGALLAATPAQAGIQTWRYADYKTYLTDFGTGTSYVGDRYDNLTSSIKVTSPANYAVLYQNRDYGGAKTGKFYTGAPNLAQWDFDNMTSSIG